MQKNKNKNDCGEQDYYGCVSKSGQQPYRRSGRQNNGKARILVTLIFPPACLSDCVTDWDDFFLDKSFHVFHRQWNHARWKLIITQCGVYCYGLPRWYVRYSVMFVLHHIKSCSTVKPSNTAPWVFHYSFITFISKCFKRNGKYKMYLFFLTGSSAVESLKN